MKAVKDWGIDVEGRKMRYQPWPLDENGSYRTPTAEEIEEIYELSGEAIQETLLYFEECGGDTEKLVALMNEHALDERFQISREELLDPSRWDKQCILFLFYHVHKEYKLYSRYYTNRQQYDDSSLLFMKLYK